MATRRALLAGSASALTLTASGVRAADDDWPMASPESQGIDGATLTKLLQAPGRSIPSLRCVVVVRNGVLIGEGYQPGVKQQNLFPIFSVTKSATSMLVGIALERGLLKSVDQTLGDLLAEAAMTAPSAALNRVTLAQILTQTSGLPSDVGSSVRLRSATDLMDLAQGLPLDASQPPTWRYSNAGTSLLTLILERAVGGPTLEFARSALLSPLGIDDFLWEKGEGDRVLTASGLILRARDSAKLAWVMADGGRWRGRQVVPAQWVAESTRPRVPPAWSVIGMNDMGYGYLWFTATLRGRPAFWGWGYGAQFALAIPSLRLAVATLASPPPASDLMRQNNDIMSLVAEIAALAE